LHTPRLEILVDKLMLLSSLALRYKVLIKSKT
jgi:hypothetical protein